MMMYWQSLEIDIFITLHNLATELREITVSEWPSNRDYYELFLINTTVRDEVLKFYSQDISMGIWLTQC